MLNFNGVPDIKNDSKDVHSKNAAAEVPLDTKRPDRDLADNSNISISTPPLTFSDDEGHESYNFNDWWAKDTYNQSGVEQIFKTHPASREFRFNVDHNSRFVFPSVASKIIVSPSQNNNNCSNQSLVVHSSPRL